jgi:hypothetical protein
MRRRISALIVSLAFMAPALGLSGQGATAAAGSPAHACCLRGAAGMHCRTLVFTCCPPLDRRGDATPPASAWNTASTLVPIHGVHLAAGAAPDTVRAIVASAHSLARLKAPPGPLYLKHLTLLV